MCMPLCANNKKYDMSKVINKKATRQGSIYNVYKNVSFKYYYNHFSKDKKSTPSIELNIDGYTCLKTKGNNV